MSCNCIEETEKSFKEHLKANELNFENMKDLEVGFEDVAFMVAREKTELVVPMGYKWKHTAKSGRVSTKKKRQYFTIQYCPFCGVKM